jgi:hypothetical protein
VQSATKSSISKKCFTIKHTPGWNIVPGAKPARCINTKHVTKQCQTKTWGEQRNIYTVYI